MNRIVPSLIVFLILLACLPAFAQDSVRQTPPDSLQAIDPDSVVISKDGKVETIESYASRYDPRKAMLYSAVFPGLGQAYNRKYWKIPLVYGGFAGIGYAISWNQERYLFYRKGLFGLLNEPLNPVANPETGLTDLGNRVIGNEAFLPVGPNSLKADIVRNQVNKFRRDRDFAVIMCFIFYMMQMVDAHVDAHLKEFDLNPQLKVSIEPTMNQNAFTGRTTGFGLTLKF
ncbi:MAG TPA: DUF5683 domain-containing protein [Cyclobacteriaceae bacterium]|nr:DUF5683 domain-containing protein [Cyclobacteriaceae bacterium]